MKTKTIELYEFDELSETAKERAKQEHAEIFSYAWGKDALESLKKLAEHFEGKLTDYEIDWFNSSYSSAKFDMPDWMSLEEFNTKLKSLGSYNKETLKGDGDCVLTGYCADEDAIDGLRLAHKENPTADLNNLMQSAFKSWLKACQDDCKSQYSDDEFSEMCEANGYTFTINGKMENM
jgi:hypothetical protein